MRRIHDEKLRSHVKTDEARRHRLAAELRANLKKRKDRGRSLVKADRAALPTDSGKG
jgi:hypothetical protein